MWLCWEIRLFTDTDSILSKRWDTLSKELVAIPCLIWRGVESDDYWKLYFMFGGKYKPPETPHPLLGWVGRFDRETYTHAEYAGIADKRPVLLYGDSFASCAVDQCFQGILNSDSGFSQNHFLLNYGVGGYGVDQIFLLYQKSIEQYENPFVILSMLTEDLDGSALAVRTGQKPFYRLINNSLALSGIPIDPSPQSFFSKNPPGITSYLFRMFIHSNLFQKFIQGEGPPRGALRTILELSRCGCGST
jgi:hypothetical protein